MGHVIHDGRLAFRLYKKALVPSLTTVVTIAVAVAFATAFFRLYDDLALQAPAGFEAPSELIGIGLSSEAGFDLRLSGRLRQAIAERSRTLDAVASVIYIDSQLAVGGEPLAVVSGVASESFFGGLGVKMHIGSAFAPGSGDASDRTAVLGYRFWQRAYGGDASVIGRRLDVGAASFTITGVAHPDFRGTHRGTDADVWFPLRAYARVVWNADPNAIADRFRMVTIARLDARSDAASAAGELRVLTEQLRAEFRDDLLGLDLVALENLSPDPQRHRNAVRHVQLMTAAAALLALIAATNLSLFFLARAPVRQREMAIRVSLGATQYRLARQLLAESLALIVPGITLGIALHWWLAASLRALPFFDGVEWTFAQRAGWPSFVFAGVLTVAIAALVAAAPLMNLTRISIVGRANRRHGLGLRAQRLVVGFQIGVAALVLSVAALFADAWVRMSTAEVGYSAADVTAVQFAPRTGAPPASEGALRHAVSTRLEGTGLAERVAFGSAVPGILAPDTYVVEAVGFVDRQIPSRLARVTPTWVEVLGARILHGQLPAAEDETAAIVSRRFAESAWGRIDVVGERIRAPTRFSPAGGAVDGLSPLTVAAVIEDLQLAKPGDRINPIVLLNQPPTSDLDGYLLVKSGLSQSDIEVVAAQALRDAAVEAEIVAVTAVEAVVDSLIAPDKARTTLASVAGALTAFLSVLGFFGVLRFVADHVRFDLALRSALGANATTLRNYFAVLGLRLCLPGLIGGLLGAVFVMQVLHDRLFLPEANLLGAVSAAAAALGLSMGLLTWSLAVRVASIEPAAVLKNE